MEENKTTIEKVSIPLSRYDELTQAEYNLTLLRDILFNDNNRLYYDKSHINFCINAEQVKLVFPAEYKNEFIKLENEV